MFFGMAPAATAPCHAGAHGVLVNGTLWDSVLHDLQPRYRCIVPDVAQGTRDRGQGVRVRVPLAGRRGPDRRAPHKRRRGGLACSAGTGLQFGADGVMRIAEWAQGHG